MKVIEEEEWWWRRRKGKWETSLKQNRDVFFDDTIHSCINTRVEKAKLKMRSGREGKEEYATQMQRVYIYCWCDKSMEKFMGHPGLLLCE